MKPFLSDPQWLILLLVCALVAWRWPVLRLYEPLRMAIIVLAVLSLSGLHWKMFSDAMDLWVLVDRSASAKGSVEKHMKEWEAILLDEKKVGDRIHFVDFAGEAQVKEAEGEQYAGSDSETRVGLAVHTALSRMDEERVNRMLLLTDGYHTEPLKGVLSALKKDGVALDYRLIQSDYWKDYQVRDFVVPGKVEPGQAFVMEAIVVGSPDGEREFQVMHGDQRVFEGSVEIENGVGRVRLTDRLHVRGAYRYTIVLEGQEDPNPDNNRAEQWIEVGGEAGVLLITAYENDPLVAVLESKGYRVQVENEPERLDVGSLSGVKVVIINNVASNRISTEFMEGLVFFVESQGGGFLMGGGNFSFGSGGYFSSKIDPLIPVSMELRREHRQLAVAMSLVLDRSGSMGASVSGGQMGVTKMDLANEGVARSIELLGDMDSVSVFAVDSEAHQVIRQMPLVGQRKKLIRTVRKINSGGGGIYVYNGLKAGWEALKNAEAGQRYMILFADASDAEQPGEYKELIDEMKAEGVKISVIGLGSRKDVDAEFLEDIAERGGGRIWFNNNPVELPALFAQETVTVARAAFIEEATAWMETPGWAQISAGGLEGPEVVDGYNLSYLKPEATSASVSGDEYRAPLVSYWQRGAGRSAAVSFPLGGGHSERIRAWDGYGNFVQTLVRWLKGSEVPPGVSVDARMDGNHLVINFYHGDDWAERLAQSVPKILVYIDSSQEVRELVWEKMRPGHYQARCKVNAGDWVKGVVQLEGIQLPFGPLANGKNAEWTRDPRSLLELEKVAKGSGGEERLNLADAWKREMSIMDKDLRYWLWGVLLLLILLDAWLTRLDISLADKIKIFLGSRKRD